MAASRTKVRERRTKEQTRLLDQMKRQRDAWMKKPTLPILLGDDPTIHGAVLGIIQHLRNNCLYYRFSVSNDRYGIFESMRVDVQDSADQWLDLREISEDQRRAYHDVLYQQLVDRIQSGLFNTRLDPSSLNVPVPELVSLVWLMVYEYAMGEFPEFDAYAVPSPSWVVPHEVIRQVKRESLSDPFVLHVHHKYSVPGFRQLSTYPVLDVEYDTNDVHRILALAMDRRCLASFSYTDCPLNPLLSRHSGVHIQLTLEDGLYYTYHTRYMYAVDSNITQVLLSVFSTL